MVPNSTTLGLRATGADGTYSGVSAQIDGFEQTRSSAIVASSQRCRNLRIPSPVSCAHLPEGHNFTTAITKLAAIVQSVA